MSVKTDSKIRKWSVEMFSVVVGFCLGIALSIVGRLKATVVVEANNKVETMPFGDVLFIQHGIDWLFYHEPLKTTAGFALILMVFLGVSWKRAF